MGCSHPVLYERDGAYYCTVCKAVLPIPGKDTAQPENTPTPPKKTAKRGTKTT